MYAIRSYYDRFFANLRRESKTFHTNEIANVHQLLEDIVVEGLECADKDNVVRPEIIDRELRCQLQGDAVG